MNRDKRKIEDKEEYLNLEKVRIEIKKKID